MQQNGEVPHGRNGHTLIKHGDYLIMFGGILEVTKESEDLYAFHIPSSAWKLIDMSQGPQNLDQHFAKAKDDQKQEKEYYDIGRNPALQSQLRQTQSSPDLRKVPKEEQKLEDDLLATSQQTGSRKHTSKLKQASHSVPRMSGTAYTARMSAKGGLSTSRKKTFGIIPTLTAEMKQRQRNEYIKRMKTMRRNKDEDAERFLQNNKKGFDESPTNIKIKNTSILKENNPSFDNYAVMMKKRKMGQTMPGSFANQSLQQSTSSKGGDDPQSATIDSSAHDPNSLQINRKNPQARDGHVGVCCEGKMLIFGGDRHHMPFNDLFLLDLDDFFFKETTSQKPHSENI